MSENLYIVIELKLTFRPFKLENRTLTNFCVFLSSLLSGGFFAYINRALQRSPRGRPTFLRVKARRAPSPTIQILQNCGWARNRILRFAQDYSLWPRSYNERTLRIRTCGWLWNRTIDLFLIRKAFYHWTSHPWVYCNGFAKTFDISNRFDDLWSGTRSPPASLCEALRAGTIEPLTHEANYTKNLWAWQGDRL